ncbi:MAG: 1-acyl-sn-glycerol-3-phosphate acyltransferase [Chloroflexi bacterium]|nr:1-acyl-sn-glycerol-3-phosphate acyltransferase [Chloroflexota bacterium]MCH8309138.1 1-acyl-sn-glycerol-3-phosphate acyltransferase [Chloroflexota bacterium]
MDWVYPACNVLQRLTLRAFADFKVTGRENVPPMGPLIIVANHLSNLDPPLLGASLPRRIRFLAKDTLFNGPPIVRWFLTSYGAFPVNREGADVRAYRWALRMLDNDGALVVFPEGTRSRNAQMQKAKPGVVGLVRKTKAPILPVAITGTEHMGTWLRVINPTGRIRVRIGELFSLPDIEGRPNKEVMESLNTMIMHRVAELLPEEYRGAYSNFGSTRAAVRLSPRR